jgi:hypothetical protein
MVILVLRLKQDFIQGISLRWQKDKKKEREREKKRKRKKERKRESRRERCRFFLRL